MDEGRWLAEQFEQNRGHLRGVAYRMLGSVAEADDAVQEAWLRLSRSDTDSIGNLGGWLTTVVARVCLDMLRSRQLRHEESLDAPGKEAATPSPAPDPEQEAVMANSVGLALLVVLEKLTPAERLAFVLHDTFDLPFDEIAAIIGRSPDATRQLASRARRRVRGADISNKIDLTEQRKTIDSFLAALRARDFTSLVAVLDPELVVHADLIGLPPGAPSEIRGAEEAARAAIQFARGAVFARPALVDGAVGVVIAPRGRLFRVLKFAFAGGKITHIDIVADPARLHMLDLAVLGGE
ncbi:MAG: sigma-70 family RNA polymerase sigma factor [Terracidiphilus sp.]